MNYEYNYTIIIPHYNIPDLLQRCLDSIPRRDDIQIIVVDDNSDPGKVDFNSFPGLQDPHVEVVFTKEGKGAGYARNVGLNKAKGKWLLFADADDYFVDDFIQFIASYLNSKFDVIYFNAISRYFDNGEIADRHLYLNSIHNNYLDDKYKAEDQFRYVFGEPWCRMIRLDFILENKIKFDEVKASNDTIFSLHIGHLAKQIAVDSNIIYTITLRRGSLVYTISKDILESRFKVFLRYNQYLIDFNKEEYSKNYDSYIIYSFRYGFAFVLKMFKIALSFHVPIIQIFKIILRQTIMKCIRILKRKENSTSSNYIERL